MKFQKDNIVRLKTSRTGRTFIILELDGVCARLTPEDDKDKREMIEPLDNLILVRRGLCRTSTKQ